MRQSLFASHSVGSALADEGCDATRSPRPTGVFCWRGHRRPRRSSSLIHGPRLCRRRQCNADGQAVSPFARGRQHIGTWQAAPTRYARGLDVPWPRCPVASTCLLPHALRCAGRVFWLLCARTRRTIAGSFGLCAAPHNAEWMSLVRYSETQERRTALPRVHTPDPQDRGAKPLSEEHVDYGLKLYRRVYGFAFNSGLSSRVSTAVYCIAPTLGRGTQTVP